MSLQNVKGGIGYSAPSFTWGSNGAINGGFNFDLPLATAASFNNAALSYTQANSQNALGFLGGVLSKAQSNVDKSSERALNYNKSALQTVANMQALQLNTARKLARPGFFGLF